jgi:outer membrane protein assembly factor BamB
MKSLLFLFIMILPAFAFGQKQVKNDWPSLANSPWPVLRGDMQGTGRSEFVGPRSYKVKWVRDMPLGVIWGPVIGYNDNLYMGERAITSDTINFFFAIDKNSKDIWEFKTPTYLPNNSGPILTRDSSIYFISANEHLYLIDKNGKLKWSVYIPNIMSYLQYPLDKNGNLYIARKDTLRIISPEGNIKKIYIPSISAPLSFSFGGDTIYAVTGGPIGQGLPGAIKAMDLDGNIFWSYDLGGVGAGIPLIDNQNNVYFFGSDTLWVQQDYLYCLKPDGTLNWKYHIGYYDVMNAPAMDHNGNLAFYTTATIDSLYRSVIISLDHNGNKRWITPLDGEYHLNLMSYGAVCDAEGKIYCGSMMEGGSFYCLDSNGVILWKTIFPYEYDSCPAIGSDGTLYIGTHGSSFFANHVQNLIAIRDSVTDVRDEKADIVKDYQLFQNYPNPFNPSTTIRYQLPKSGLVTLKIFDILGNVVTTLINDYKDQGIYNITFDASRFASDVYIYQIKANEYISSKKMLLIK